MQCLEKINVTLRRHVSAEEFLRTHPILLQLADEANMSVENYVADGFLPNTQIGESYGDWVIRQAQEVLNTQLWQDSAGCYETHGHGAHTCQHVEQVEFDEDDRQYVANTFGEMPEVQRLWLNIAPELTAAA